MDYSTTIPNVTITPSGLSSGCRLFRLFLDFTIIKIFQEEQFGEQLDMATLFAKKRRKSRSPFIFELPSTAMGSNGYLEPLKRGRISPESTKCFKGLGSITSFLLIRHYKCRFDFHDVSIKPD
ncbi:MAG: hypothetical protein D6732_05035 [Methanobacteriota archaeon]|nr:MAG: hypothetical protein D6732_05035 [Euryarchaeota archaeon]